jgi:hypothetical protein
MGVASRLEIPGSLSLPSRVHVPTSCAYRGNPQRNLRVCVEWLRRSL